MSDDNSEHKTGVTHVENTNDPSKSEFYSMGLDKVSNENIDFTGEDAEMEDYIAKFLGISENAKANDSAEKMMPLIQGLKTYPKAALWSMVLSTALVMEGYDTNLLSSFYALPAFAKKYGELTDAGTYEVAAKWQTGLSMCTNVGEIIGLQFAGIIADRIGYRKTLIGSLFLVTCFIFILFFAQNCATLAVGEILLGIPWGAFQTLTVTYASEVCPLVLRFYLTTYVNVCWVFGQLISSGVLKSYANSTSDLAYRVPFAIQWIWPVPIMVGIFFAPESPWWLVRKNRMSDAKRSLQRLMTKNEHMKDLDPFIEAAVGKMKITTEEEARIQQGSSYIECFKGTDGRRTRIASMVWVTQNACGAALMGYSTYFYTKAGLDTSYAFDFSIIQYCLGILGTLLSWFASRRFGRFTLYFGAMSVQTVLLIIIGGLGCASSKSASWGIGSLLLVYVFFYDLGVGPVCYCLVSEIPSTRLRAKTIVLARNFYNVMGVINAIWTPYMLNTTQWNWGAKTGFFWAGISIIFLTWMWLDLPETKGRTFAELDELFSQGVKARKFKYTEVDPFEANHLFNKLDKKQIANIVDASGPERSGVVVDEEKA